MAAISYSRVMDSPAITSNKQTVPRPCHSQNVLTSCLLHSYCLPGPIDTCRSGKALLAVHQIPFLFPSYHTKLHIQSHLAVRCGHMTELWPTECECKAMYALPLDLVAKNHPGSSILVLLPHSSSRHRGSSREFPRP